MKAVIQRVKNACVTVEGKTAGSIGAGLLVYLGVASGDTEADAAALAEKTVHLRIFADSAGKMNLAVGDVSGGVLAVSQFTLLADARKGRRPFFGAAADPETARRLYACFTAELRALGCPCEEGIFRAHMEVASTNDGPVTIILDSRDLAASGGGAAH